MQVNEDGENGITKNIQEISMKYSKDVVQTSSRHYEEHKHITGNIDTIFKIILIQKSYVTMVHWWDNPCTGAI